MLDEASGHFVGNLSVTNMLKAANSASKARWADLQEEGWHQVEQYESYHGMHITFSDGCNTFHCCTKLTGKSDRPKPATHVIGHITYLTGTNCGSQPGPRGTGSTPQMVWAYSRMVRSDEKRPMPATLRIAICIQAVGSRYSDDTRSWQAMYDA